MHSLCLIQWLFESFLVSIMQESIPQIFKNTTQYARPLHAINIQNETKTINQATKPAASPPSYPSSSL